jgi:hypothetical protein
MRIKGTATTATNSANFEYTINIYGVKEGAAKGFQASNDTDAFMADNARTDDLGKVVGVEVKPAKDFIEMADGTFTMAELPNRYDVTLTLQLKGTQNDRGYFTPQQSNIGSGGLILGRTKYVFFEGYVGGVTPIDTPLPAGDN